ncbi:hypothetical protein [Streptomyces yaizuensis]|uniref:Uncharacterized protein n=1 Tax=Streptomyces yaizuensis TaxID=2989713 RepID=A0ABQ5PAT9_9ACTN|nr:hypothetical protein [Streptomyces sp. YSPA8]GLF99608.1 hypothetical protein SYYSPA8_34945 [Streptomyces sp. YSPA8]
MGGGLLVSGGLIVLPLLTDLDVGDKVAGIVGAVMAVVAVVAAIALAHAARTGTGTGGGARIRVGRRGTVVVGDVTGSAVGDRSQVTGSPAPATPRGPSTPPASPVPGDGADVRVAPDGTAIIGDLTGSALGDDSHVTHARSAGGDSPGRTDGTAAGGPGADGGR